MEFSCTARRTADRVVLTVAGDLDLAAHKHFQAAVDEAWDGSSDLVVDCSGVTFLDSMGLRVLVTTIQRATDNGRSVALAAPSRPVVRVLDLAGVRGLFTEVETVPDTERDPDPDPA
jgi:stage II sporulation protein AA (anti-sigma F factor antagonist)